MNQLIPDNFVRCYNSQCDKKENCKRFLQMNLDKTQKVDHLRGACDFKAEGCEKIIPLKREIEYDND